MAKMVNPNTINDMTLVNVKAQAKMNQLVQKIGKGKRKIKVTLGKSTRSYLTKLIEEMKKLQIRETIKGIDNMKTKLKWYNFLKKGLYKTLRKQNEMTLEELGKTTAVK